MGIHHLVALQLFLLLQSFRSVPDHFGTLYIKVLRTLIFNILFERQFLLFVILELPWRMDAR